MSRHRALEQDNHPETTNRQSGEMRQFRFFSTREVLQARNSSENERLSGYVLPFRQIVFLTKQLDPYFDCRPSSGLL